MVCNLPMLQNCWQLDQMERWHEGKRIPVEAHLQIFDESNFPPSDDNAFDLANDLKKKNHFAIRKSKHVYSLPCAG